VLDGQRREEAANLLVAEFGSGPAADKGLKSNDPKAVSFEGPPRVIAEFDRTFQVSELLFPGGWAVSGTLN
jgi:hypothetical protein